MIETFDAMVWLLVFGFFPLVGFICTFLYSFLIILFYDFFFAWCLPSEWQQSSKICSAKKLKKKLKKLFALFLCVFLRQTVHNFKFKIGSSHTRFENQKNLKKLFNFLVCIFDTTVANFKFKIGSSYQI